MLGVTLRSDLSWNDHISTTAKAAACKLGLQFRSRRYFTPSSPLTLYKAQIHPCLEYGSHLWRGASKHSLATLGAIQKRAIKLIGYQAITNSLDSMALRRTISALSLYYSVELKSIIPRKPSLLETRGFRTLSTPSLSNWINRTSAFANSFIPMTSRNWNSLPATVFPATYNLQLFKTRIHRHLQLLPSP